MLAVVSLFNKPSFQDQPMVVQSTANVTINARNESGSTVSQFFVGNDEIVAKQKVFKVEAQDGRELLYADKDVVRFGYNKLKFASKFIILQPVFTVQNVNKREYGEYVIVNNPVTYL